MASFKSCWHLVLTLAFVSLLQSCARPRVSPDAAFQKLVDEYLSGYLAWRPATGTSLGLHEYDGGITDMSRASLDAELRRLKEFDQKLARINPSKLTRETAFDYRLLQSSIRNEIFGFEREENYSHNPMTYAQAIDLTQYIKRNFAPLENRVRS